MSKQGNDGEEIVRAKEQTEGPNMEAGRGEIEIGVQPEGRATNHHGRDMDHEEEWEIGGP